MHAPVEHSHTRMCNVDDPLFPKLSNELAYHDVGEKIEIGEAIGGTSAIYVAPELRTIRSGSHPTSILEMHHEQSTFPF
jgi:hypothetical protein